MDTKCLLTKPVASVEAALHDTNNKKVNHVNHVTRDI